MWIVEIAKMLKERLGDAAKRVPTRQLPNWLVRLAALNDPAVKQIIPELGKWKNATSEKAQRVLGWTPRSREDSVVATAESMIRLGLLKSRGNRRLGTSTRRPPVVDLLSTVGCCGWEVELE